MKNDFYEKRVFANKLQGINLNQLDREERNNLLINHNILVQRKVDLNHTYFKNAKKNNTFIEAAHEINPLVYKEIISDFLLTHSNFDLFHKMKMIDLKIESKYSLQEKIKSLDKIKNKINKKLLKIDLYYWYKLTPKEYVGYGEIDFHHHIKLELENKDIYSYLTSLHVNYYKIYPFDEWIKILDLEELIKFCKKRLDNISMTNTKGNGVSSKPIKSSKYPLVFLDLEKENIFKEYLKHTGAIDKNNKQVNGVFQPACDAFFEVAKDMQNDEIIISKQIFQTGRNRKKFIAMLIEEYGLSKTTSKLSNGKNYCKNAINFIENH